MNIAIYARVSTDMQAEKGHSLGAQVADCTAKAKAMGATIIKEYVDDGYSGAYLERPALESMREAIRAKMFQAVIVHDVDRLSRNLSHQLLLTDEIERNGASLHFVNSNYESTPEGRMFYAIKGAFAGYEREKFRERSMRGRVAMLKKGQVIQDSHVYGYDYHDHHYIINAGEAYNIKAIYKRYLAGNESVRSVTLWLNENLDKFPPPNGKWWVVSTVQSILQREMYTGKWYAHKIYHFKTGVKSEKKEIRNQSEWIEMSCPAIIDRSDYEATLKIMKRNQSAKPRVRSNALLQGLAVCGFCGRRLSVRRGGHNGQFWYTCWLNENQFNGRPSKCGNRNMLVDVVDNAVWELLKSVCKSPKTLKKYVAGQHKPVDKPVDNSAKIDKIKAERKAVMAWFSQQLITHDEAQERLEALKSEEERLMKENIPAVSESPQMDAEAIVEAVSTCAEIDRELFRSIIEKIILSRTDKSTGRKNYELNVQLVFR